MQKFDVAIAGAGLIGGSIALELAREGLTVALFDCANPGQEASWAGAGILSPAPETSAMIPMVALGQASLARYPAFIATIEELSGHSVGFRQRGTLETLFSSNAREELSTIIALHHGLGLRAEALSSAEARELEPEISLGLEAAILRPDECSVDNRLLTAAVLEAAQRAGVQIFPNHPVRSLQQENNRCVGLQLDNGRILSNWTIVAAGSFSSQIAGVAKYAPVRPAKGQMLALRPTSPSIQRVLWSEHAYLVPRNDGRILVGATVEYAGFAKDLTAGGIQKLLAAAIQLVPNLATAKIAETWAGLRPDSPDHLPILGPTDLPGLLVATGHFRSGILLAPVTARVIRDWVLGTEPTVNCDRFSPMRFVHAAHNATV